MSDHDGLAVAPKSLLEDPRQLGVPVVDVVAVVGAQGIDAVSQGQEGAVDVSSFYHSLATILKIAMSQVIIVSVTSRPTKSHSLGVSLTHFTLIVNT